MIDGEKYLLELGYEVSEIEGFLDYFREHGYYVACSSEGDKRYKELFKALLTNLRNANELADSITEDIISDYSN